MSDWKKTADAGMASVGSVTLAGLSSVLAPALDILSGQLDLSFGGVTHDKIALLAVDSARISDLEAAKITAGTFVAGVVYAGDIVATQITTGTLTIGGNTLNASVSILDASNAAIGWIGQSGGSYGAWFKTLGIGGASFAAANLKADSSGNVSITSAGGTTTVSLTSGYVDVSDSTTFKSRLQSGALSLTYVAAGNPSALHNPSGSFWLNSSGTTLTSASVNGVSVFSSGGSVRIALSGGASPSANFSSCPIQISGTTVIDASKNCYFSSYNTVGGIGPVIDNSANGAFNSLTLTTALSIANGGTGGTTVAGARAGLGIKTGVAQFSGGSATVTSGLSSVVSAVGMIVSGVGATEVVNAGTPSGGSVTFQSSAGGSSSFFFYAIFGTP